jgi:radical SAM-linked protein
MRFASHRDVARAIERGVRKAGIPVAYSAGFSPHPRISYSGGAPTGSASEAEYLELAVTRRCEPDDVGRRLDAALPDGIDVIEVVEAGTASAGLQLEASAWEVTLPGVTPGAAASAILAFLAESSVEVQRLTSKGTRTLDARAAVISMTCDAGGSAGADAARRAGPEQAAECAILRMIVRQLTPAVRPDDILAALRQLSALEPASPPLVTRLWQGPTSALDAAQTGAQTGMIAAFGAAGPDRRGQPSPGGPPSAGQIAEPPIAISQNLRPGPDSPRPEARLAEPGPAHPAMVSGQAEQLPGRKTDKAMRLEAESAVTAPASQTRANEQLPRGTLGQLADPRAREPYGRDCPDARNRATQQTARPR